MEQPAKEPIAHVWYMRPVFFVSDAQRARNFYIDKLGFVMKWQSPEGKVCQVDRGGGEIILCEDDTRKDHSRLFLELTREGLDQLLQEIAERSLPTEKTWWGYDVLQIKDPDENEILVCLEF